MNKKYNNFNDPIDIDLPKTGYTPVDTVGMEAALFKGMGSKSSKRSLGLRIAIIILSSIFFVIPGIALTYLSILIIFDKTEEMPLLIKILSILIGILVFVIGARIIYPNFKK